MKKVLYFYPSNKKTIAFNTLMAELIHRGYEMYLLTTCERGILHKDAESIGVKVFANPIKKTNPILYYISQIIFLVKFCKKHKIEVVLSNLQHVNFISVFAQYFVSSKFVIYRHHFMYHHLSNDDKLKEELNRTELFFDKVINNLSKQIIVPANSVRDGMIKFEGVNPNKISIMQYLYDFENYAKPNYTEVEIIRDKYRANLLLLMCSRLILFKRHHIVFPVIKKLVKERGLDIKLIVIDEGPERENLQQYIIQNNLENNIFLLGYKTDFINYMSAADLLVHPSLTEASNSAVKEMALLEKTSIVCDGVGDFSDYFVNLENGFLISAQDSEKHIENILMAIYNDKTVLESMGKKLKSTVLERFSNSNHNIQKYIKTFES